MFVEDYALPEPTVASPDVFTIEALAEWLRTKEGSYSYTDVQGCLLYQYFRAKGLPVFSVGPIDWIDSHHNRHRIPGELNEAALLGKYTFGAARRRCRRILFWRKLRLVTGLLPRPVERAA